MAQQNLEPPPSTKEILLKEYELCQNTTQRLESTIWQSGAAMAFGLIGTLVLVGKEGEEMPWFPALMIGILVCSAILIWFFMARRWWSVQHMYFLRMRHIEQELGIHAARYVWYLTNQETIAHSDLQISQQHDLESHAERLFFENAPELFKSIRDKRRLRIRHLQRLGSRSFIWVFPWIVLVVWVWYLWWLGTQDC